MARILVIDDDPSIRQLLAYVLADAGYDVDLAPDGRAALAAVEQRSPDLILLDMKMPVMDGWEFARLYRQHYDHQAPIVVMTAARDAAQRSAAIQAENYIAKPFDLDALLDCLDGVMQGHRDEGAGAATP